MNLRQKLFLLAGLLCALPVAAQAAFQQPRLQTVVNIQINVTNPLGRLPVPMESPLPYIIGRAESLHFSGSQVIAQAQKAVRVEAEVSPNPNATTLYTDQTSIIINATAGQPITLTCPFKVFVNYSTAAWNLRDDLYTDFIGSAGGSMPGGTLQRDYYITPGSPVNAPVAFNVYSDNGGNWTSIESSTGSKVYCVNLALTVPTSVYTGTYSSNAIYTLYY